MCMASACLVPAECIFVARCVPARSGRRLAGCCVRAWPTVLSCLLATRLMRACCAFDASASIWQCLSASASARQSRSASVGTVSACCVHGNARFAPDICMLSTCVVHARCVCQRLAASGSVSWRRRRLCGCADAGGSCYGHGCCLVLTCGCMLAPCQALAWCVIDAWSPRAGVLAWCLLTALVPNARAFITCEVCVWGVLVASPLSLGMCFVLRMSSA